MKPRFFRASADFRRWLEKNHANAAELLVGFHKVASGKPSITWPQSVDEALAFGWIDGVRRRIDDTSYSIRFTPRRPSSIWSAVNIKRVGELTAAGRMRPAGLAAFERRSERRSEIYSFERKAAAFDDAMIAAFQARTRAWTYFDAQPASYKRAFTHWVTSAKRPETRERRLGALIAASERGQRVDPLAPFARVKNG